MAPERQFLVERAAELREVMRTAAAALHAVNERLKDLQEQEQHIDRAAAAFAQRVDAAGMEHLRGTEMARVEED